MELLWVQQRCIWLTPFCPSLQICTVGIIWDPRVPSTLLLTASSWCDGIQMSRPHLINLISWGKRIKIHYSPKAILSNEQFKYITKQLVFYNKLPRKHDIVFLIISLLKRYWFTERNTHIFFSGLGKWMDCVSQLLISRLAVLGSAVQRTSMSHSGVSGLCICTQIASTLPQLFCDPWFCYL